MPQFQIPLEFRFLSCFYWTLSGGININTNTMQLIYNLSGITLEMQGKGAF